MHIAPLWQEHVEQVLAIYQLGIDQGNATFETTAPTWEAFDTAKLPAHRLVALDDGGRVLGWAAVVPVSDRCAYAGVVGHSVYVHPAAHGRSADDAHRRAPERPRRRARPVPGAGLARTGRETAPVARRHRRPGAHFGLHFLDLPAGPTHVVGVRHGATAPRRH
ncbi:N-acetyltransferase [Streptomyces sp. NPDC089795]|uniref:GNAT family N-acetyltransferase n=1 Tax=Streptomyces sp. NPDC089795 TaxID=3155297 RepID=UPI003431C482